VATLADDIYNEMDRKRLSGKKVRLTTEN
jgi:hypothetical protein